MMNSSTLGLAQFLQSNVLAILIVAYHDIFLNVNLGPSYATVNHVGDHLIMQIIALISVLT